jgi:uncharacterized Rmd1/YagE family protein
MKPTTVFNCYKIAATANLQRIAEFFRLTDFQPAASYLLLLPEQLETVLKYQVTAKYAWLFKSGSICLVNFDTAETYRLVRHLETIGLTPDFESFSVFNELHTMESRTNPSTAEFLSQLQITAIVLVKSTELKKLETMINITFDWAERFILELQKGFPNPNKPGFLQTNLAIIKLQLIMIHNLKILDRPHECSHDTTLRQIYDTLAKEYELSYRYHALQKKINYLNEVLTPYQKLGFTHKEQRLEMLETILLLLFPLSYFFESLIDLIKRYL